jgi:hypothetical protein
MQKHLPTLLALPLSLTAFLFSPAGAHGEVIVPLCGKTTLDAASCIDIGDDHLGYYESDLAVEITAGALSLTDDGIELELGADGLRVDGTQTQLGLMLQGPDAWGALLFGTRSQGSTTVAAHDGYLVVEVWNQPMGELQTSPTSQGTLQVRTSPVGQGEVRTNNQGNGEAQPTTGPGGTSAALNTMPLSQGIAISPDYPGILDRGEAGDNLLDRGMAGDNLLDQGLAGDNLAPRLRIVVDTRASRTGRNPQTGKVGKVKVDAVGQAVLGWTWLDAEALNGLLPFVDDRVKLGTGVDFGTLALGGDTGFVLEHEGHIGQLLTFEDASALISGSGTLGTASLAPIKTGKY